MRRVMFILLVITLIIPTISAQDGRENLLDILNAVPDQMEFRESIISYIDYRAMVDARAGAATPESIEAMMNGDSDETSIYMATLMGINSGPDFIQDLYTGGELWAETVGFEFFDMERAITFGNPPELGNIVVGDFDTDAIEAALSARDYTSSDLGDFVQWCGAVGCENGMNVDIAGRNPGNPFGGRLGRQEPLLVSDNMIINALGIPLLIMAEDAVTDKADSLADNANYAASVNSINPDYVIIQAQFVHFSMIALDLANIVLSDDTDVAEQIMEEMMADAENLPQYNLVMFADTATETEQVVYVTLVYSSLDDAEIAVDVIPTRIDTAESLQYAMPLSEIFESRNITDIVATAVQDDETELAVAVFEFHAPLASNEMDDGARLPASSMVFQLFIQMLYSRDTAWLATAMS